MGTKFVLFLVGVVGLLASFVVSLLTGLAMTLHIIMARLSLAVGWQCHCTNFDVLQEIGFAGLIVILVVSLLRVLALILHLNGLLCLVDT